MRRETVAPDDRPRRSNRKPANPAWCPTDRRDSGHGGASGVRLQQPLRSGSAAGRFTPGRSAGERPDLRLPRAGRDVRFRRPAWHRPGDQFLRILVFPVLCGTRRSDGHRRCLCRPGCAFPRDRYQDEPEQASAFLDEFGRGTNYSYVVDPDSRAIIELGVFGVPETYIIDADGIIQGKIAGEVNAAVLQQALDQVLAGETPDL